MLISTNHKCAINSLAMVPVSADGATSQDYSVSPLHKLQHYTLAEWYISDLYDVVYNLHPKSTFIQHS